MTVREQNTGILPVDNFQEIILCPVKKMRIIIFLVWKVLVILQFIYPLLKAKTMFLFQ